jgi:hypothetical protein
MVVVIAAFAATCVSFMSYITTAPTWLPRAARPSSRRVVVRSIAV